MVEGGQTDIFYQILATFSGLRTLLYSIDFLLPTMLLS